MMETPGLVALNGDPIGKFTIDDHGHVVIVFDKGAGDVEDTLRFADEQGMIMSLHLDPTFGVE